MSEKLIVTYDKSQDDVPVLMIGREGYGFGFNASINVVKVITGDKAEQMYRDLTLKDPEFMTKILGKPYERSGDDGDNSKANR